MKLLINQPFGLGDVIFCMTLARNWIKEGHTITWPVFSQFVDQLNRAYPDVTFIDWQSIKVDYNRKDEHDWENYRVVPLRWNVQLMNVPYKECMSSKYSLFGLDWNTWKEGARWERDEEKEMKLFGGTRVYYLTKTDCSIEPYRLINNTFGSDSKLKISIPNLSDDLPNIYMQNYDGYSLFDWALILERATEIHTVSTSIIYILEMLDISCPIHIYKREPIEKNHDNYSYILKSHNYILK